MPELSLQLVVYLACVGALTLSTAICDIRIKKIPNKITLPIFGAGLLYQAVFNQLGEGIGKPGLIDAAAAFATGFGMMWVLWMIGGGGGGDVKLLGALSVWIGFMPTCMVLILSTIFVIVGTVGVMAGACAYFLARRRLVMSRFKRNFRDRQQTLELPIRLEISHDQLLYEVGGVTQLAKWPVVDELFRSHEYWIFHAQAHALFAPRRLFPSEEAERKFLALALSHMSPGARARSADAIRFAGEEGPAT